MEPKIQKTKFGSITIGGETFEHDVLINLDGSVKKRKKKLSKQVYGTSHILSLAEAEYIHEDDATRIVFGTGQFGQASLSQEASEFLKNHHCAVDLLPTPEAIEVWNELSGKIIGLFHVTC